MWGNMVEFPDQSQRYSLRPVQTAFPLTPLNSFPSPKTLPEKEREGGGEGEQPAEGGPIDSRQNLHEHAAAATQTERARASKKVAGAHTWRRALEVLCNHRPLET